MATHFRYQTLVFDSGRLTYVGPTARAPGPQSVVDYSEFFVMPGLRVAELGIRPARAVPAIQDS